MQANRLGSQNVAGGCSSKRRSGCPVSVSLDLVGDRWSLLIVRDMMVRGFRTFKEFLASGEGIATNVLADRLRKLRAAGIVIEETDATDGRKVDYRLTEKGIDLAPVLLDLLIWGARHEPTGAPCEAVAKMSANREEVLAEVRRRWEERDPRPFLPNFSQMGNMGKDGKGRVDLGRLKTSIKRKRTGQALERRPSGATSEK